MKVCLWILGSLDSVEGRTLVRSLRLHDDFWLGGNEPERHFSGTLLAISRLGRPKIAVELVCALIDGLGRIIYVVSRESLPIPCLLTEDFNLRMIYDGPATVRERGKATKAFNCDNGLPLVASEWIGFAFGGKQQKLVAFSSHVDELPITTMARYPAWDVEGGDHGIFDITLPLI